MNHIQSRLGDGCCATQSKGTYFLFTLCHVTTIPLGLLESAPAKLLAQIWAAWCNAKLAYRGIRIWPKLSEPISPPSRARSTHCSTFPLPPNASIPPSCSRLQLPCTVQQKLTGFQSQRLNLASMSQSMAMHWLSWLWDMNVLYGTFATLLGFTTPSATLDCTLRQVS